MANNIVQTATTASVLGKSTDQCWMQASKASAGAAELKIADVANVTIKSMIESHLGSSRA
jgi:hypothetical protein